MKKATLTIELNGKVHVTQSYSYRKEKAVLNRLQSLAEYYKQLPHLSNAEFKISL